MATKNHCMIRRQPFAKAILLAIAGTVACNVATPLVARESVVSRRGAQCLENRRPPLHKEGRPGDWTFVEKCSGRRPLLPLESPERASEISPGQARAGARDRCPPSPRPGSPVQRIFSSPPDSLAFGRSGGRGRVRGGGSLPILSLAAADSLNVLGTKHDLHEWARPCPLTLALSPNTKNVLGEREQIAGMLTQGTPSDSCRWACPGLPSDAPLGLYKEEAASCRFTNVQAPGLPLGKGGLQGAAFRNQSPLANGETTLPELSPPLGIPSVPFPKDSPPTRERIELGKRLFFDPKLSSDESVSCSTCHNPEQAFADNEATSRGIGGQKGIRNTPTVINAAFQPYQFWDGRASSLEDQALLPLENPAEMGSSVAIIVDRLNQLSQYRDAFRRVFDAPVTGDNLARALASFERTILAGDSGYDRYAAGNPAALSQKAAEGMKLFVGKAHCRLCHQGYNFNDGVFHNLGVGWDESGFTDEGRSAVTDIVKDRGAFKTPTLRQIAQTAPYMHDGSLPNLEAVVDFYDRGGKPNPHLDPLMKPLRLTPQEKEALVEFLRSLSGKVSFYR